MRGTRIEMEVEICTTNLANKTKCMNTIAWKKLDSLWRHIVVTASAICEVKPEHPRL
jgi:hypothetical protein